MPFLAELKRRNVIRVSVAYLASAWLLIQIADTVFPAYGVPESTLSILITVLMVGLVPAVVVSWFFELTPSGFKRDSDVPTGDSITHLTGRGIDLAIIALLALGIGYFAFDKFVFDPARDEVAIEQARHEALVAPYDKSVAVLPFADLSPDGDKRYFSDGIAEELLNLLARLPNLRVISRSSSFAYRGSDVNIPEVGRALGVSYVLEGSVRSQGDSVRVTAQLIEAATDTHLWSETYDGQLDSIFDIQDTIAAAITDKLKIHLLRPQPRSRRTSPDAYEMYLRASHLGRERGADPEEAFALTRRILEIDPTYVPALTLQSHLLWFATETELATWPGASKLTHFITTDRALAIDPGDGVANVYKGWNLVDHGGNIAAGVRHVNRALAGDPQNHEVLRAAGAVARLIGQFDQAIQLAELAVDRDPLCRQCRQTLFWISYQAGDYERASQFADLDDRPADRGMQFYAKMLIAAGREPEALEYLDRFDKELADPAWNAIRAVARCRTGELPAASARMLAAAQAESGLEPDEIAWLYTDLAAARACTSEVDAAFTLLERARDLAKERPGARLHEMSRIVWSPLLKPLHGDPRWAAFRTSTGLGEEQIAGARLEIPPDLTVGQANDSGPP